MLTWLTAPPPNDNSPMKRSIVFWSRLKMNAASGCESGCSLPVVNRLATFRSRPAAFLEIFGFVKRSVLRVKLGERLCLGAVDREMRRRQSRPDPERPAGGYLRCDRNACLKGLLARRRDFLHHAHAKGLLGTPVITGY